MSRATLAWTGLVFLLVLGVALGWGVSAARSGVGTERVAASYPLLPLPASVRNPGGRGEAFGWQDEHKAVQSIPNASPLLLQRDTNIAYGYTTGWKAGDQLGVVLQASSLQYPLTVQSVECYLFNFSGYTNTVTLRGHVYSLLDGRPGVLLRSSSPYTFTLALDSALSVSLPLTETASIAFPQPFLVAIEYVSGTEGQVPSVVSDISTGIPRGVCYYQVAPGVWREHYALWPDPSEVGFSMIRAWADTTGGPGDETISEPEADAFLAAGFPRSAFGVQEYLLVGDDPLSGDTRALLRFPLPQAPVAGATPLAATLRLFRYSEVTRTLPLTVTAYRITSTWDESSATWNAHSASYAEGYGSGQVPAQHPQPTPTRGYFLCLDVSGLVQKWLQGVPNDGLMLIGDEDVSSSAKRFYSHELATDREKRPRLIVKWALPAPTQTLFATQPPTPSPTATVTPEEPTLSPTSTSTLEATTPQSTRTSTVTPTASVTPSTGTPTRTLGPTQALYLPLVRKR